MITKRTKIMLGVLILVAIGAYAYLYWWSQTPNHGVFDSIPAVQEASDAAAEAVIRPRVTPEPSAVSNPGTEGTPTAPSTSYRTFENTEFSFSFAYPDNWMVSETQANEETRICVTTEGGTGGCLISLLLVEESVNASAEKSLEALKAEFRSGNITESARTIGDARAEVLRVASYPEEEENSTRAAVFTRDGMIYVIETAPGQEAIFDRVADSFLFTM